MNMHNPAAIPADPFARALAGMSVEMAQAMLAEMEQMQSIRTKPAGPFEKAIGTMTVEKVKAMIDEVEQRVIPRCGLRLAVRPDFLIDLH